MPRLSQADLVDVNKSFEERTPQELIEWGISIFGTRIAALSSMQKAGSVISHMLHTMHADVPILFVDTGVLFDETLATRDRIAGEYGLEVRTLRPKLTMAEQTAQMGVLYLSVVGQEQCCQMRKSDPLLEVKDEYDALIGSLRRSDGDRRAQCPILAIDQPMNCLRINPLVNFTDEQMGIYVRENNVIINPLHAQGYSTIGCNRCTTPVLPDEPKRAGRWRHLGPWSVYCGINPTDLDPATSPSIELTQDLVDRVLGRQTDFVI
ncbi:MAG: phosphoadenylyl-sulfate reductase [Planctomycetaceae bacterium]